MALHEIQIPPEPPAAKPRPRLEEVKPPSSAGHGVRTAGPWRPGPASAWRSLDEAPPAAGEHAP